MWREIPNTNGRYLANEIGQIKSVDSKVNYNINGKKGTCIRKGKILKQTTNQYGYLVVSISMGDKTQKVERVHRLVASTFIPNPQNKPVVNHLDGNKKNNNVSNLEWATVKENNIHAFRLGLNKGSKPWKGKFGKEHSKSKPVIMCDLDGNEIKTYDSITDAAKEHGNISHICSCLKGKRFTSGGYKWKESLPK